MSYAIKVIADSNGKFIGNQIRLATRKEAEAYARDLYSRWTAVQEWRVVESTDPVNYKWTEKGLIPDPEHPT